MKLGVLFLQKQLVECYHYSPLPSQMSQSVRSIYQALLPEWCHIDGDDTPLYSLNGTKIASRYNRIVIGDYGAFIEILPADIESDNLICKPGQEFRICDPKYSRNVKYNWLTTNDQSDCKIYHQKRKVTYADYQPKMYYISPYEVKREI